MYSDIFKIMETVVIVAKEYGDKTIWWRIFHKCLEEIERGWIGIAPRLNPGTQFSRTVHGYFRSVPVVIVFCVGDCSRNSGSLEIVPSCNDILLAIHLASVCWNNHAGLTVASIQPSLSTRSFLGGSSPRAESCWWTEYWCSVYCRLIVKFKSYTGSLSEFFLAATLML